SPTETRPRQKMPGRRETTHVDSDLRHDLAGRRLAHSHEEQCYRDQWRQSDSTSSAMRLAASTSQPSCRRCRSRLMAATGLRVLRWMLAVSHPMARSRRCASAASPSCLTVSRPDWGPYRREIQLPDIRKNGSGERTAPLSVASYTESPFGK